MIVFPEIPKNTSSDTQKINQYLTKIIGRETASLLNSCYFPKISKYFEDLKGITGLTDEHLVLFLKQIKKEYRFQIISDPQTLFFIICIAYYIRNKKYNTAQLFYYLFSIKFYGNIIHKFLQYCKKEIWDSALADMSQKHLFKARQGIPNTVLYLAKAEFDKSKFDMNKEYIDDKILVNIVYRLRQRLAQSFRSFMNKYFELSQEVEKQKTTAIKGDEELGNIELISQSLSNSICNFRNVDIEALKTAITNSGIRKDLCIETIKNIMDPTHIDKLRFIIILTGRVSENIKNVCKEQTRLLLIRKLITKGEVGSYSVKEEILELLYSLDNGYSLKTINKNQLLLFFITYIILYIRNKIC